VSASSATELVVASANFGGGVDSVPAVGERAADRTAALVDFFRAPSGAAGTAPLAAVVQEMTRLLDPAADYPSEVAAALGAADDSFYVPCNTTDWFPLREKWGRRWAEEGIRRMEEGMATYAAGGAALGAPEPTLDGAAPFTGLVMPLPTMTFAGEADDSDGWLEAAPAFGGPTVRFRPAAYSGNRDTDPRAATAHRVTLPGGEALIVVNVHLATLRNEIGDDVLAAEGDELERSVREPTAEAVFMRYLHMDLVARFIDRVHAAGTPVVVVGDFNATPDAAELRWFLDRAGLTAAFDGRRCWNCGASLEGGGGARVLYSSAAAKEVLTDSPERFRELVPGEEPQRITAREVCPACGAPLFTHKRNFRLIDNVAFTDPAAAEERGLRVALELAPGAGGSPAAGIRLDTYFSDHLPVWCRLRHVPLGR
jgi:hypothetical protein